jgi:hypothetical protein
MRAWGFSFLILLLISSGSHAAFTGEIRNHEEVTIDLSARGPDSGTLDRVRMSIGSTAYELELQPSERAMRAAQRWAPGAVADDFMAWEGRVVGADASWVRLSTSGGGLTGAIGDGSSVWLLDPASAHPDIAARAGLGPQDTIAYRLADFERVFGEDFRHPPHPPHPPYFESYTDAPVSTGAAYTLSAGLTRLLEVTFVFDVEYRALFTTFEGAALEAISTTHTVDGFYASAVNLRLEVSDLIAAEAHEFDGANASELLEQLAGVQGYYVANQLNANKGVVHLLSGKDILFGTVGLAYVGTACRRNRYATGVNIFRFGPAGNAKLLAHELGHNLNASHDDPINSGFIMGYGNDASGNYPTLFSPSSISQFQTYFGNPGPSGGACLLLPDVFLDGFEPAPLELTRNTSKREP